MDNTDAVARILYVDMVYEPGLTPAEAMTSYWRDYHVLEKICQAHGGNRLQPIEDDSLPVDNGDGSWKVQTQACVASVSEII